MELYRNKIIEILKQYLSVNKRIHEGWINNIADDILQLTEQPEPDTNTPFFGNVGAEIPMKEVKSAFDAISFVESCNDLTTYVDGKDVDERFKKLTIPVIEFNDLRERAKQYASQFQTEQRQAITNYGIIDIAKWLNEKGYRRGMDVYLGEIAGLIKSFIEEHQFTTQRSDQRQEISNEMIAIEILARFHGNSRGLPIAKKNFIDGVKWAQEQGKGIDLREQRQVTDLREKLIKFLLSLDEETFYCDISASDIVDKYLQSISKGQK